MRARDNYVAVWLTDEEQARLLYLTRNPLRRQPDVIRQLVIDATRKAPQEEIDRLTAKLKAERTAPDDHNAASN